MSSQPDLFGTRAFERSATFATPDIRLALTRRWAVGPIACVIGHNPSDASADIDDPTSRWWARWFKTNGYAGYTAVNPYPFCSADPAACRAITARAIAGEEPYRTALFETNPETIVEIIARSLAVFVCWGGIARDPAFIERLLTDIEARIGKPLHLQCWGTTQSGAPIHPLARGKSRIDPNAPAAPWHRNPTTRN